MHCKNGPWANLSEITVSSFATKIELQYYGSIVLYSMWPGNEAKLYGYLVHIPDSA